VNMTVPDIDPRHVKTVDTQTGSGTPRGFTLFQNYPNPFNSTTQIRYALERRTFVTIRIFTILGQEVATLVQSEQGPGSYAVEWEAAKAPSGVYVYRFQAGGSGEMKKMIVLR
jgi:Secretion system C-terminal sorting domain